MKLQRYAFVLLIAIILMAYQNCSQVFFQSAGSHSGKTLSAELVGGNGEGYEGKPQGDYLRTIPDWKCEDKPTDEYARLSISPTTTSGQLVTNAKDMCGLKKPDVPLSSIRVFPDGDNVVALNEGIYQKSMAGASSASEGPAEAWCQSYEAKQRLDVLLQQDGSRYKATVVRGVNNGNGWQLSKAYADGAAALQAGSVRSYKHPSLELSIEMSKDSESSVLQYDGQLELSFDGEKIQKTVSCRMAQNYDPVVNTTYCDLRASNSPYANSGETGIDGNSPEKAFVICTPEQLNNIGANTSDWDKHFILKSDLDMAALSSEYKKIGNSTIPFTGSLDGLDFQISNLTINKPSESRIGLFGAASGATIKNLSLINANMVGIQWVGGLVGYSEAGILIAIRVEGNFNGQSEVGGLAGLSTFAGLISHSHTTVTIKAHSVVGGLIGRSRTTVSHSTSRGQILSGSHTGGLVGWSSHYPVQYSSANVELIFDYTVSSTFRNKRGGLIGWSTSEVSNCSASGNVEGIDEVGGLIGSSGKVTDSYATGTVVGRSVVGGLVGSLGGIANLTRCYATGDVVATGDWVGGLLGQGNKASPQMVDCFVRGRVSGNSTGPAVGPLTGDIVPTLNTYYDTASTCTNPIGMCNSHGISVNTTAYPNYFYDPTSAPMNTWDFANTWISVPFAYPQLQ